MVEAAERKRGRGPAREKATQITTDIGDNLTLLLGRELEENHTEIIDKLQEIINKMDAEEQELNDKLAALGAASSQGFTDITNAVNAAADRVIAKLEASDVDLSDEIAAVEGIKTAVSEGATATVSRLAQIAPDAVEQPEEPTPPNPEEPAEPETPA